MHYPQGPLAIVDHLVISPTARGYGAFFSFCDLIAGYLEQQRLAFDHVVSEVMLSTQVASSVDPLVMMRLLRIVGFKVAKLKYWAPDPSIVTDPNGCRAALMLASQPERVDLPADELIRLVGIIYRVHYGGWYERTMSEDELAAYRAAAGRALQEVEEAARTERRVTLNGMRNFDLQFALDPSPRVDLPTFAYILILAIPAAVGVATALVQERLVAVGAICAVTLLTAFAVSRPRFRRGLLKLFRL